MRQWGWAGDVPRARVMFVVRLTCATILLMSAIMKAARPEANAAWWVLSADVSRMDARLLVAATISIEVLLAVRLVCGSYRIIDGWLLLLGGIGSLVAQSVSSGVDCGCFGELRFAAIQMMLIGALLAVAGLLVVIVPRRATGHGVSGRWEFWANGSGAVFGLIVACVSMTGYERSGEAGAYLRCAAQARGSDEVVFIVGEQGCKECKRWIAELRRAGLEAVLVLAAFRPQCTDVKVPLSVPREEWWSLLVGVAPDVLVWRQGAWSAYDTLEEMDLGKALGR